MKLISLQMHNFRQFYGTTPVISFAKDEKNVTVIHAENGAGKTALLNAFTWVLYDSYTKGFGSPTEKINKRALVEANTGKKVTAWVKLIFEHNHTFYEIKKQSVASKDSADEWSYRTELPAEMKYCGEDGIWHTEENVADAIGKILPKDLHSYFFFDGERIERIVQPTKKDKEALAQATKKLLGLEVLNRSIDHLNYARTVLEKELKRVGDPETNRLLQEKEDKEEELQDQEASLEEHTANLENFQEQKKEIEKRLRALKEVEKDQERRDELNEDLEARKASLRQTNDRVKQIVAKDGYTVFLETIANDFKELIESLRQKGELPAGIKRTFVKDILDAGKCICGRSLNSEDDAKAQEAVEAWLQKAGIEEEEKAAYEMGVKITDMQENIPVLWDSIDAAQAKEETDRAEIARIENELDEIRKKLEGISEEGISSLQHKLNELEESIDSTNRSIGATAKEIDLLEEEIKELQERILKHKGLEDKQKLAQRRVNAAVEARDRLKEVYENRNTSLRKQLETKINHYFNQISVTPYTARLDANYSLQLFDQSTPIPIACSQGENQILCLSFIAGFVDLAREWMKNKEKLTGPISAEYPIVMDSPFGALDKTNRRHVTEHINKVADQVVMMVSTTQWRGEVNEASISKVGKSYVFSYYTSKDDFGKKITTEIQGHSYDLVCNSPDEFEYTEVIEVNNG